MLGFFFPDYNPYKRDLIFDLAKDNNAGIILLTESHLHKNIHNNLISSRGWSVFGSDRDKRMCGGVLCLAREEFLVGLQFSFSTTHCEILGIYLSNINVANITIYRPPDSPYEHFLEILNKARNWISELESSGIRPKILLN